MSPPGRKPKFVEETQIQVTRASKPWSKRAQLIAVVGWSSFLVAALGTMLFFAFVDPGEMEDAMSGRSYSRMTGYAMGFFFFWLLSVCAAAVSVYMVFSAKNGNRSRDNAQNQ